MDTSSGAIIGDRLVHRSWLRAVGARRRAAPFIHATGDPAQSASSARPTPSLRVAGLPGPSSRAAASARVLLLRDNGPAPMELHIGQSVAADPREAAEEAVTTALVGASAPAFALVLTTDQYDATRLAEELTARLGSVPWAGATSAGVFAGDAVCTMGLVVGVFSSRDLRVGVGLGGPVSAAAREAGRTATASALSALPVPTATRGRALIVFPDALTGNAAEVIRGAALEAGSSPVWAGGGAGDNLRYIRSSQFAHGRAFTDRVVVIALDAATRFASGIRHGWRPYGPPSLVTRAHGSVADELDFEVAFDVYRRTAARRGDDVTPAGFATFAMTHPLGIPQIDGDYVIRDPLGVEPDGSLRCVAEIPDGSWVRVMDGDRAALLAAARSAADEAREAVAARVGGALVFDCVSRSLVLGEAVREEVAALRDALGSTVPMIGCLTFGEVGAFHGGMPQFHNKTAVVLAWAG